MGRLRTFVALALLALLLAAGFAALPALPQPHPGRVASAEAPAPGPPGLRGVHRHDESLPLISQYSRCWAVVIGIDAYPGGSSGLEPLMFASNDAREVRDVLRDEFGFAAERIRYLVDRDANRAGVRDAFLRWLPSKEPGADDAVLVFYAGHGLIDEHTRQGYLAAVDSRADDPAGSCLAVEWLRDQIAALPCRHKLVFLDSCYSGSLFEDRPSSPESAPRPVGAAGGATRGAAGGPASRGAGDAPARDNLSYYMWRPAFLGMSAGRFTPVADGLGATRHSVFTAALLQVLRERADSPRKDHAFTFRQLAAQVETRVANALDSRQVPDWGRLGPGDGDFVFRPTLLRQTPSEKAHAQEILAQRGKFALALKSAEQLAEKDPERALENLEDTDRCPLELRDFAWRFEYRLCKRDRLTLPSSARSIALSPDGRFLAAGGAGLTLLDAASGRTTARLDEGAAVNAVRFSPDGRTLAAAQADGAVQLWDATSGRRLAALAGHKGAVEALAFSPDALSLVSGGLDGTVRVWDLAQGKERVPAWKQGETVSAVAFSPDGTLVAAAGGLLAVEVGVRDWAAGRQRWTFPGGLGGAAGSLAFSPDGKSLLGIAAKATIWDLQTGKGRPAAPDVKGGSFAAAYAPDGETLALGNASGVLTLVDATGRTRAAYRGPPDAVLQALAFAPDGKTVAALYVSVYPNTPTVIKLWDLDPGPVRSSPEGDDPWATALSPDGRLLAVGGYDGGVKLTDTATGKAAGTFSGKHRGPVQAAAFSPDGRLLATSGDAGDPTHHEVKIWDVAGRRETATLIPQSQAWRLAFSPDGSLLATTSVTTTVWDLATGAACADIPAGASAPVFSPDGKALALAEGNGRFALWDPRTGRRGAVLQKPVSTGRPERAAFSPDGATLAAAGRRSVRLWDVATGEELAALAEAPEPVTALAFSADGKTLAAGGEDGSVRLCDPVTGQERVLIKGLDAAVQHLAFFDGDDRLEACGRKGDTAAWRAAPAAEPVNLRHVGPVSTVAFGVDGKMLWAGSNDPRFQPGVLRCWDVETGRVRASFEAHGLGITGLAPAADGETLVSGGRGLNLALGPVSPTAVARDAADGKRRGSLQTSKKVFSGGCFVAASPAEGLLAVGWGDEGGGGNQPWGEVRLWDGREAEAPVLFTTDRAIRALTFSPDGGLLAAGLADGAVRLWDVKAGMDRAVMTGDKDSAQALAFSPDGKRLVAGGNTGTLRLWDAATGKATAVWADAGKVAAVAFAPDGKTLAAARADGTVVLRDPTTGAERRVLTGHTRAVSSLAYSPDGSLLASGSADQTVKLWRIDVVEAASAGEK